MLNVSDATLAGNSAAGGHGAGGGGLAGGDGSGLGGAIFNNDGSVSLVSSTVTGNSVTLGTPLGGGIYNLVTTGSLSVTATILAGNGQDVSGAAASGGSNLLGDPDGNGFVNGTSHDQTGVANAMLATPAANGGHTPTCAVLAGSPAIGGDYTGSTTTDQRGVARASHTIGAFEYVAPSAPLVPAARTHVLWNNSDGRVMLWNVDAQGGVTQNVFGPYDDTPNVGVPGNTAVWSATALATGPDGMNHLLWNNPDGRVMLWTVDNAGNFTYAGFGPYTDGAAQNVWSAAAVSVGADNLTHLLWSNTDHRAMLWNVDSGLNLLAYEGFGPYTDDTVGSDPSVNLWGATAVATGADNVSRLLWGNTDARMMLWDVDGSFGFTLAGFGPYTDILSDGTPGGQWAATAVSAAP